MASRAAVRAAQPSAEDDFYGQEGDEGPGAGGQGRQDGGLEAADDASLDDGQGQEEDGQEEGLLTGPLDDEDDFFAPPSRGEHRQQTLANENRQLRQQLDELRGVHPAAPPAVAQPQTETDEQFEARIQLLGFEDKMEARYRRDRQLQNAQMASTRIETAIAQDRANYQAKAAKDKRFERWGERVEAEFERRRQLGQLVSREDILKWMLGDRLVSGDDAPVRKARQRAKDRVDRQTTRPSNAGSDVSASRRGRLNEREARARRLDGVQI
jgi:hypothetical protein